MNHPRSTPEERFWQKIVVDLETGCWMWHGTFDSDGYPRLKIPSGCKWHEHIRGVRGMR